MKNYWIITVADPWCDLLLRGLKTMELRKKVPNVQAGDIIFVCRKGGGTTIIGVFKLISLESYTLYVLKLPEKNSMHRVKEDEMFKYARESNRLFGLVLKRLKNNENIKIEDFGYTRNPQNFYRIKVDFWYKIPKELWKK